MLHRISRVVFLLFSIFSLLFVFCDKKSTKPKEEETASITGYVYETGTNRPISEAVVCIRGIIIRTDADGYYRITDIPFGRQTITASVSGHSDYSATLNVTGDMNKDIYMDIVIQTTFILPGGATMEMLWVNPGTFLMGSLQEQPEQYPEEEVPQHEVTISRGFWLGKYELTQEQWESVMGTRPWAGKDHVVENPNHPAVYISWNDTQEFISKLNEAEGTEVYGLPTEAEWEYACRAGTTTRWSFGDDVRQLKDHAWYYDHVWQVEEPYAHAVGTKLSNSWGLYDMHGNVWEWCQDWYDSGYYSVSPSIDPQGPSSGWNRVIRGGCFFSQSHSARSASRGDYGYSPAQSYFVGARLLKQDP